MQNRWRGSNSCKKNNKKGDSDDVVKVQKEVEAFIDRMVGFNWGSIIYHCWKENYNKNEEKKDYLKNRDVAFYHLIHMVLNGDISEDNCKNLRGIYLDNKEPVVKVEVAKFNKLTGTERDKVAVGNYLCYRKDGVEGVGVVLRVSLVKVKFDSSHDCPSQRFHLDRNLIRGIKYTPQITLNDNVKLEKDADKYIHITKETYELMKNDKEKVKDYIQSNETNFLLVRECYVENNEDIQDCVEV